MAQHLLFSENLTPAPEHDGVRATFIGQAHIAGTGPRGTTCRECVHFGKEAYSDNGTPRRESHKYFGKRHPITPFRLKDAFCLRPILNKADRLIPHDAPSCRLFEASEMPPPALRQDADLALVAEIKQRIAGE